MFSNFVRIALAFLFVITGADCFGKTIKVCFTNHPPWQMIIDEKFDGPEVEMFKAIGEKLKMNVVFTEIPFKRSLYFLKEGDFDIIAGLFKTSKRSSYIKYVSPPYKQKSNKAFYLLKNNKTRISKFEDLYPLKIGTQTGWKYFPRFDRDGKLKKHSVGIIKQNILMLIRGRIDVMIGTDSAVDYQLNVMGFQNKIRKSKYGFYNINPVYIGISRKSHLNKKKYISVISDMVKSRETDKIINRFFVSKSLPVPDYK